METPAHIAALRLDGGHVALDFVNTLGGSADEADDEHLRSYGDLLAWSLRVGALREAAARRLARLAAAQPAAAERALAEALAQRARADAVLRPLTEGREPPGEALRAVEEDARRALERGRLERSGEAAYGWRWEGGDDLLLPLWPLAYATVELLAERSLDRLKPCRGCRWLFLDRSKNRSRRWCSMEECGTYAKKRRYVERRRAARTTDSRIEPPAPG